MTTQTLGTTFPRPFQPIRAVLWREWLSLWRDRGGYFSRSLYAVGLLLAGPLAIAYFWIERLFAPERIPEYSRSAFHVFAWLQFAMVHFFATLIFARSLLKEKEAGALELLVLSELNGFTLLFGKVLSELCGIAVLLCAGLPSLCFLLVMGGVVIEEVIAIHLILLSGLFLTGAVAIALSTASSRFYPVVFLTNAVLLVLYVGPLALEQVWPHASGGAAFTSLLGRFDPSRALAVELGGLESRIPEEIPLVGVHGGILVVAMLIASRFLERVHLTGRARPAKSTTLASVLFRPLSKKTILFRSDALLSREMDIPTDRGFATIWLMTAGAYLAAFGSIHLFPWLGEWIGRGDRVYLLPGLGLLGGTLLLSVHGSLSILREKRSGTLETLLSTDVDAAYFIRAKVLGLFAKGALLLFPAMVHGIFVAHQNIPGGLAILGTLGGILAWGLWLCFVVLASLYFSLRCSGEIQAMILATVSALAILLVSVLAPGMVFLFPLLIPLGLRIYASLVANCREYSLTR